MRIQRKEALAILKRVAHECDVEDIVAGDSGRIAIQAKKR
jgi:hypothetical protein